MKSDLNGSIDISKLNAKKEYIVYNENYEEYNFNPNFIKGSKIILKYNKEYL